MPASDPAVVDAVAPPLRRKVPDGHCATADSDVPTGGLGEVWASGPVTSRLDCTVPTAPVAPVGPLGPVTPGAPCGPAFPRGPSAPGGPTAPFAGLFEMAHAASPTLIRDTTRATMVQTTRRVCGRPLSLPAGIPREHMTVHAKVRGPPPMLASPIVRLARFTRWGANGWPTGTLGTRGPLEGAGMPFARPRLMYFSPPVPPSTSPGSRFAAMGRLDLGRVDEPEASPPTDEEARRDVAGVRHSVHGRTYPARGRGEISGGEKPASPWLRAV
jgi:hypothetical protein